jgi:putative membrane protein
MDWYAWVKAAHIIVVIAFMAGMLYLPRLLVYHAEAPAGSAQAKTFGVMERRLLWAIITPALLAVWVSGLWLAYSGQFFKAEWLHAKLALVIVLTGLHGLFARYVRMFAENRNVRSPGFFRVLNEVPTVAMIAIVILVVVKPF